MLQTYKDDDLKWDRKVITDNDNNNKNRCPKHAFLNSQQFSGNRNSKVISSLI
jgi:hypothetical protein